jgi:uncharacterized membrane-anchored protein
MQNKHLPTLGSRFWWALCLASIFGANMGDFFAHNLGLGHVAGLPFLAIAFAVILVLERFDRLAHEVHYWLAIVVVRTAATNLADFFSGDMHLPRPWVMATLAVVLAIMVAMLFSAGGRSEQNVRGRGILVLRADTAYWTGMLVAGTLGTVIADYLSHNLHLGDDVASILLSFALAVFFATGRKGLIWWPPFYWATVIMVRAAGTAVGDYFASRGMLGLPLSTFASGVAFLALLFFWNDRQTRVVEP